MNERKNNPKGLLAAVLGLLLLVSYGYKAQRAVKELGGHSEPKTPATPRVAAPLPSEPSSSRTAPSAPAPSVPQSSTHARATPPAVRTQSDTLRESQLALLRLQRATDESRRRSYGQNSPASNPATMEQRLESLEQRLSVAPAQDASMDSRIAALEKRMGTDQGAVANRSTEERVTELERRVANNPATTGK